MKVVSGYRIPSDPESQRILGSAIVSIEYRKRRRLNPKHLHENLALVGAVELGQYHALPAAQYELALIDRH